MIDNPVLRTCIEEHERDHADFIRKLGTKCQCDGKPDGWDKFTMTRPQQVQMECRGYGVEASCLRRNMAGSSNLAELMRRIQTLRQNQRRNGFNCDTSKW